MTDLRDTDAVWGAWRARQTAETAEPTGFARMLALCLDLKINWIDHADIYDDGAVESLHGAALDRLSADQRAKLRVISKCGVRFPSAGQPGVRIGHYRSDGAFIRQQAEASLTRLKTERIDLYLLHRPDYLMRVEESARALEDLKAEGKIARYGASNFSARQLDRLASTAPGLAAHQIEFSPLHTTPLDDGTFDQAQQLGLALLAWSPLGGGRLFDESDPQTARVRQSLARAAERLGCDDVASIALAWVRRAAESIPVLGTMNAHRLEQQVRNLRSIELDAQDWYEILEASRGQPVP